MIAMLALLLQDLPTAPEGWNVELVAKAPALRHPTVVCAAPDGRVFVGEDPMDISAPADARRGRVLCVRPDGKITVFAENLHAPFGMRYLEGKLYVLHNPTLSLFTDDQGVGRDRVDLIASTNPKPWALDWNDHVPANFKLAMDGYFYMAVGDKGLYGAVGADGSKAELRGGGILRFRPGATELEVFCSGVRNILDVALDDDDEIFTYDNTDEHHWMGRFTHMVDGGFYGYPWDFHPRRPYTLWMIADYGAGAATNILRLDDGSFLLADFGKRSVARVRLEREGASFRHVERVDVLSNGGEKDDFRPVGICATPDGLGVYVSCWNHKDDKEDVAAGRLFKVTWPGRAPPMPAWFAPAAMGRPFEASEEELTAALDHPSREVRLTAQRRLADRKAAPSLTRGPVRTRIHALWVHDAVDGGVSARAAILELARSAEPGLRRQALRQLGTRRVKAVETIAPLLKDPDASVRFHAATALGRAGDPAAVPALLDALEEKDLFARFAAFTALRRIGAWGATARGLEDGRASVREGVLFAMREAREDAAVEALARFSGDAAKPGEARAAAVETLAGLARALPPWKGEWWTSPYHPALSPPPERTHAWSGTSAALRALLAAVEDPDARVRKAGVDGLRELKEGAAAAALRARLGVEGAVEVKRALLRALGALRDKESRALIEAALADPALAEEAVGAAERAGESGLLMRHLDAAPDAALRALGRMKVRDAVPLIARRLNGPSRDAAVWALGAVGGEAALEALLPALEAGPRGVLEALGRIENRKAIPALLAAFARDEAVRDEAAAALARMPDARALDAYLHGLASPNASLRESCREAARKLSKELRPEIEARVAKGAIAAAAVEELRAVYPKLKAAVPEAPAYFDFAMKNAGDAARGRAVFAGKTVACSKCHKVGGAGGDVGPDLSGIGLQFGRKDLAESVLYPSRRVREGYGLVVVRTKGGEVLTGILRGETGEELILRDAEGVTRRVAKEEVERRKAGELSMMPENLRASLSLEEFADLLAYLETLRAKP
ncbi:MAG TPA: HEAT repeat domain-containing protein [Planctomycetota bacterium]